MEALQLFLDNFADWDSFVRIWPLLWQGLQLTVLPRDRHAADRRRGRSADRHPLQLPQEGR
jgi:hypothetical protein